jgi:hypothetical protein
LEDWKIEKREFGFQYAVPVPSHLAHEVSPSSKLMCGFISKMFPWLQYPEGLLFRKENVPAAHLAYPGQRLTAPEHFQSLRCSKADLAGAGVILFDDVRATGKSPGMHKDWCRRFQAPRFQRLARGVPVQK